MLEPVLGVTVLLSLVSGAHLPCRYTNPLTHLHRHLACDVLPCLLPLPASHLLFLSRLNYARAPLLLGGKGMAPLARYARRF